MLNKLLVGIIIVIVIALIGFTISTIDVPQVPEEEDFREVVEIAEEWISENAKTYIERGGSDLRYIRTVEIDEGIYEITFEFETNVAGYGEVGEDEMVAQVITAHTIVVIVENEEVVSVITNNAYDEIESKEVDIIGEETTKFNVYFVTVEDEVEYASAVERTIPYTEEIATAAIEALIDGPNLDEEVMGYSTSINSETELLSIMIEDGVAYADFSSELEVSGGSAMVMMIREQIEKTLLQFETIDSVVISIEGDSEEVLQP